MSCPILSCPTLLYPVLVCPICPVLSCPVLPYPILPSDGLSVCCLTLSYLALFCPILPYSVLPKDSYSVTFTNSNKSKTNENSKKQTTIILHFFEVKTTCCTVRVFKAAFMYKLARADYYTNHWTRKEM